MKVLLGRESRSCSSIPIVSKLAGKERERERAREGAIYLFLSGAESVVVAPNEFNAGRGGCTRVLSHIFRQFVSE